MAIPSSCTLTWRRFLLTWFRSGGILLLGLFLMGTQLKPGELIHEEAMAYRVEGRHFQETGRLREALSAYQKALIVDPKYAEAYNDLGVVLEALGNLQAAEDAYKTALQLEPKQTAVHSNLALLYERKGMIQEAANHWAIRVRGAPLEDRWVKKAREKLIECKLPVPESPDLIEKKRIAQRDLSLRTGRALLEQKKWDEAILEFKRVLEIDPTHEVASAGLKKALAEKERGLKVRQPAKLQVKPEIAPARPTLVKDTQKRETAIARALKDASQKAGAVVQEKEMLPRPVSKDAKVVAEDLAEEREKTWSRSTTELYERAVTAMRQGRYEDAVTHFKQVLALKADHEEAKQGLKRAQAALEKSTKGSLKK